MATAEGWLYLAVILDQFSRRVVGWKLSDTLEANLVGSALENALRLRQPGPGLVFHSDRGSQYSSHVVRRPLELLGASFSMSAQGNCYDNAKAEAFFSTLKAECFPSGNVFSSKVQARRTIFEYIETYYNNQRLHSAIGYQSPRLYEAINELEKSTFSKEKVTANPLCRRWSEGQASKRNKRKGPALSAREAGRLCRLATLTEAQASACNQTETNYIKTNHFRVRFPLGKYIQADAGKARHLCPQRRRLSRASPYR